MEFFVTFIKIAMLLLISFVFSVKLAPTDRSNGSRDKLSNDLTKNIKKYDYSKIFGRIGAIKGAMEPICETKYIPVCRCVIYNSKCKRVCWIRKIEDCTSLD